MTHDEDENEFDAAPLSDDDLEAVVAGKSPYGGAAGEAASRITNRTAGAVLTGGYAVARLFTPPR